MPNSMQKLGFLLKYVILLAPESQESALLFFPLGLAISPAATLHLLLPLIYLIVQDLQGFVAQAEGLLALLLGFAAEFFFD